MIMNWKTFVCQRKAQASHFPAWRKFLSCVHLKEVDDYTNTRYNSPRNAINRLTISTKGTGYEEYERSRFK